MNTALQASRLPIDEALLTSSSNSDLIQQYLSWKRSYTVKAHHAYRVWVTRFQNFVDRPPELLSYTDYVAFAESIRGQHASYGIQFALNIVHNYLRFFAEQGRLRFPLFLIRVPKGIANPHNAVTEEEYRKIVEHLRRAGTKRLRDLAVVMLLHDTGMRVGELVGIDVDDVEEDYSAVIRTEKTTRRRRVFWNADTDEVLQRYLVQRINKGPAEDRDPLFIEDESRTGRALTTRTIQRMFRGVLKKVEITQKLSPHSFRHAFIHRLARLSVPDAIIAQLVGHSTPFTIAHYTKLSRPEFEHYSRMQLDASAQS